MKRHASFPRQRSLILPEIQNPFHHRIRLGPLSILQVLLMSVTVAPIRLLLAGIFLLLAWPIIAISLLGRSKDEEEELPLRGWRKLMRLLLQFFGQAVCFSCGFYKLTIKGERSDMKEAPLLCAAPHSTFWDSFVLLFCDFPSVISRGENARIPLFGTLIRYTQPVFVSRDDPNSRVNTIKEIKRRAQSKGKWPQIIIFPEGTCTNRSCLISYKLGAFYPGVPVQPVLIRYKNDLDTVTWTWDGPGAFVVLWLTLCQFKTDLEIEYLPVYRPSEEEILDPKLYADNVRAEMAKHLKIPVTDHTYDDCKLMEQARRNKLPMASGIIEFYKLHKKLGLNFDTIKEMFERFCKICKGQEGRISVQEFAEYLHLPWSQSLQAVFDLYDRTGSGYIDFREYIIGLSLVSGPAATEETIKLAFQLFDTNSKGYLTEDELSQILHDAFGMDEVDTGRLFREVDVDQDGHITYDEFEACAQRRPEYAKLFMTYQEMSESNGYVQIGPD